MYSKMIPFYQLFIALLARFFTHLPVAFSASNPNRGEIYFQPKTQHSSWWRSDHQPVRSQQRHFASSTCSSFSFLWRSSGICFSFPQTSTERSTSVVLSFTLPHSLSSVAQTRCLLCEIQPGGKWKSPYSLPDTIFSPSKNTPNVRVNRPPTWSRRWN